MADTGAEKIAERYILFRKIFQPLALLRIGHKIGDTYCLQFNENGYDKSYNYYKEDDVISRLAEGLSDDQLVEAVRRNPEAMYSYSRFVGKYYTFDNAKRELTVGSAWPEILSRLEEVFRKHGRAAWAVLKAYLELREDRSAWSSCDYSRLQYKAWEG